MSTRQLDNTTERLPELRASAQKYRQYTRPEPEYAINTSALGRAFPDFTQAGTSSDDGSFSIEVGRGVKKNNGTISRLGLSREFSSNAAINPNESSYNFSAPMIGNYEVMSTPPALPKAASKTNGKSARHSLRRDASIRRASNTQKETTQHSPPLAKTTDYVSGGSRQGSAEHRRTLAEMQAHVTDTNDDSRISQDRPPTVTLTTKNTRFGNGKTRQPTASDGMPERFSSAKDFMQSVSQAKGAHQQHAEGQANVTTTSTNNGGTQQSFMLPDMPNLSELISGVYEDGTPVFAHHSKAKASRFVSGSQGRHSQLDAQTDYAVVGEIPVPADEQAIFLSLKLLQDRVAEMETNRAEAEKTIQELQQMNWALEAEKSDRGRRERCDSALGMTVGGSEAAEHVGRSQRKWIIEKSRQCSLRIIIPSFADCCTGLEAAVRGLQDRADAADRKVSISEITIRNITQDRDSAVSQLGVAYYTTEELKRENVALKEENHKLKSQITRLTANTDKEQPRTAANSLQVRKRGDRKKDAVQNTIDLTANIFGGNHLGEQGQKSSHQHRDGNGGATGAVVEQERSIFSMPKSEGHEQIHASSAQASSSNHVVGKTRQSSNMGGKENPADFAAGQASTTFTDQAAQQSEEQRRQSMQALIDDLSSEEGDSDNSAYDATTGRQEPVQVVEPVAPRGSRDAKGVQASAQDLTYLSFLDVSNHGSSCKKFMLTGIRQSAEIANLRKTLEEERVALKQQQTAHQTTTTADGFSMQPAALPDNGLKTGLSLPRKSSMKDVTGRLSNFDAGNANHGGDQDGEVCNNL